MTVLIALLVAAGLYAVAVVGLYLAQDSLIFPRSMVGLGRSPAGRDRAARAAHARGPSSGRQSRPGQDAQPRAAAGLRRQCLERRCLHQVPGPAPARSRHRRLPLSRLRAERGAPQRGGPAHRCGHDPRPAGPGPAAAPGPARGLQPRLRRGGGPGPRSWCRRAAARHPVRFDRGGRPLPVSLGAGEPPAPAPFPQRPPPCRARHPGGGDRGQRRFGGARAAQQGVNPGAAPAGLHGHRSGQHA